MSPILMKKIASILFIFCFFGNAFGQMKTDVKFTNDNGSPIHKEMQGTLSKLITELNFADANNSYPSFQGIKVSEEFIKKIIEVWDNASVSSPSRTVNEILINTTEASTFGKGYQVRNIPVTLRGREDGTKGEERLVVYFDYSGEVINFNYEASKLDRSSFWNPESPIEEGRIKTIENFLENFKTAYNRKEFKTIEEFLSPFALIITGQVVKRSSSDQNRFVQEEVIYTVRNRDEYIQQIKRIFSNNEFIDVKFSDFKISRHNEYSWIYGVNLIQNWNSPTYKDIGHLFLIVDFKDEKNPILHVRAWQKADGNKPLEFNNFKLYN
jgi:hypothetical protein